MLFKRVICIDCMFVQSWGKRVALRASKEVSKWILNAAAVHVCSFIFNVHVKSKSFCIDSHFDWFWLTCTVMYDLLEDRHLLVHIVIHFWFSVIYKANQFHARHLGIDLHATLLFIPCFDVIYDLQCITEQTHNNLESISLLGSSF